MVRQDPQLKPEQLDVVSGLYKGKDPIFVAPDRIRQAYLLLSAMDHKRGKHERKRVVVQHRLYQH